MRSVQLTRAAYEVLRANEIEETGAPAPWTQAAKPIGQMVEVMFEDEELDMMEQLRNPKETFSDVVIRVLEGSNVVQFGERK